VNDLSARRVVVCRGTYTEQVTVERSLTLEGRPGAVIQAPPGEVEAIVLFRGPQTSRLRGFQISGAGFTTVEAGVQAYGFVGEDIDYGPTHLTVSHTHVSDIYDTRYGRTDGIGIFIYQAQGDVSDNTVERYGYIGIAADGSDRAGTFVQIDDNTVRGAGVGGASERQVGIYLDETPVDVEDNTISGNYGFGADGEGVGILVEFANGSIRDNAVRKNDTGVRFAPGIRATLRSNEVSDSAGHGIELLRTFEATIVENESSDNGGSGIYLAADTHDNSVRGNTAADNGAADIVDESGPPPANSYTDNTCDSSSPDGLCEE
jgi:parallel beta-helix repeat protein